MSRAFVSEDRHEEPRFVPPRSPLPDGLTNYVTKNGLQELKDELEDWEQKLENLSKTEENEKERRRESNFINDSMMLLKERLVSAVVVPVDDQPKDEVRFAAKVNLKIGKAARQTLQIVGVDEADVKKKKIAFTSPLAKAIQGKKEGETATLKLGAESRQIDILS